jgi:hypothetical protein
MERIIGDRGALAAIVIIPLSSDFPILHVSVHCASSHPQAIASHHIITQTFIANLLTGYRLDFGVVAAE